MTSNCSTGKRCYDSLELAREGLIAIRARNALPASEGPQGVYRCQICDCYHLTSSKTDGFNLSSEDEKRIEREGQARFWEEKFKKK